MDKSNYCIYVNIFFSLFFERNSLSGKNTGIKSCFCFLFTDVFLVYMWYNVYFLTSIKIGKERLWHTSMRTGSMEEELVILVCFIFFLIFIFTLFYFTILYWFCHTLTWIHHGCICLPKHEPPSHLPPHNISLGHPRAPAPSMLYPASDIDWRLISYMIGLL